MKQKLINNKVKGQLLIDLSKAFGRIQRNKLWWILYEKGIPTNLLKIIILGHTDTKLCARHNGKLGTPVNNNTGIFQGSPLSALLFIIYADYAMNIYTSDIINAGVSKTQNIIRDDKTEHSWTNYILKLKHKKSNDPIPEWKHECTNNNKTSNLNYYNFADDTNIDIMKIKELPILLYSFSYAADKVNFMINWFKTNILLNKITPQITNFIKSLPEPYNKINIVTKAKVLGHIMTAKNNITETLDNRLQSARIAWKSIKKSFITNQNIDTRLRLNYYNALITTILLYSTHLHDTNETTLKKLQSFHSGCIRYIVLGKFSDIKNN